MSTGRRDDRTVKSRRQRAIEISAQEHGSFVFQQEMSKHLEQRLLFSLTTRMYTLTKRTVSPRIVTQTTIQCGVQWASCHGSISLIDECVFSKIATPPRSASDGPPSASGLVHKAPCGVVKLIQICRFTNEDPQFL